MSKISQSRSRVGSFLLLLAALCANAAGQAGSESRRETAAAVHAGIEYELPSALYGAGRRVSVGLPRSYAVSAVDYPVVIVLDGDAHFEPFVGLVKHLAWADRMPEVILVAVPSVRRAEELVPMPVTANEANESEAITGSLRFRQFLTEELLPHLDAEYRCAPHRTLIGHSLGGLFVVDTLLSAPDSFSAYIAISPSVYWKAEAMLAKLDARIESGGESRAVVHLSRGDHGERPNMVVAADRFAARLEQSAFVRRVESQVITSADHFDASFLGACRGLRFLFEGWRGWPMAHNGDWPALRNRYAEHAARLGYAVAIPEAMLLRLRQALGRDGEWGAALEVCARGVRDYPRSAGIHDAHGEVLTAMGRSEDAVAAFERACELAEASGDARLAEMRARLVEARGR